MLLHYKITLPPQRKDTCAHSCTQVKQVSQYHDLQQKRSMIAYVISFTLSPISDTNINVNAAVKPDFAIAAKSDEGPPFTKATSKNTNAHPNSTRAIERG